MPWGPEVRSPSTEDTQAQPSYLTLDLLRAGLDPTGNAPPSLTPCFRLSFPHQQPRRHHFPEAVACSVFCQLALLGAARILFTICDALPI